MTTYAQLGIRVLNEQLNAPSKVLQKTLSLKMDNFPEYLRTPVGFFSMVAVVVMCVVYYANNLLCNVIGILYPVLDSLVLLNTVPAPTNKLVALNQYWVLYGGLVVFESLFGFILRFIPFYYYFKFGFIYLIVRNNFYYTSVLFNFLDRQYTNLNLQGLFAGYVSQFNNVIDGDALARKRGLFQPFQLSSSQQSQLDDDVREAIRQADEVEETEVKQE